MIDVRHLLPSGSGFTGRYDLLLSRVYRRVWHHTVSNIDWNTAVNATVDQEVAHLLAIDRMHLAWGLNGFGYHNAAFASGRAYHVGSYDKARAHVASGQNSYSIGTVLIGNFTLALPSEGHMAAAQECKRDIERFYGRDLDGLPHLLVPGQNTVCPGSRWQEWVPLLEKEEETMSTTDWHARRWPSGLLRRSASHLQAAAALIDHAWSEPEYEELADEVMKGIAILEHARLILRDHGLGPETGDRKIDTF